MLIKICGITSVADGKQVSACGADFLGLMFAASVRRIDLSTAGDIIDAVAGKCVPVAVFKDQSADRIEQIVRQLQLQVVQLHGSELPAMLDGLAERLPGVRFIKAMGVTGADIVDRLHDYYSAVQHEGQLLAFLVDAVDKGTSGGTGKVFHWDFLSRARQEGKLIGLPKLILAGGLSPDNVREAIKTVRPDGVDISTGVEIGPGKKDPQKVAEFITAARAG